MWRLRLVLALWCLWRIAASYFLQRRLARLFPRSARVQQRWERVHAKNARRLRSACLRLRGVYIKLGQVLSVMGTFLPDCYVLELEQLQDAVPPRPWRIIERALEKSLGRPLHASFARFSRAPIAAASLGQVHEATLHDGRRVAVKVLYPGIRQVMELDLQVLALAVRMARRAVPIGQLERMLEQLREMLARETDLAHEAESIAQMRDATAADADVVVPEVIAELSNGEVLTMTFMEGVKITDVAGLSAHGLDSAAVATKLVQVFFRAIFHDRFFHADPHPGNLFVQRGDKGQVRLVMLDLGSAAALRDNLADGLMAVIAGALRHDEASFMRGIHTMGFVSRSADRELLSRSLHAYFERILSLEIRDFASIARSESDKLDIGLDGAEVRKLMRAIEYPLGWFYLERAMLLLFGVVARLAPELNLIQVGFPYVAKLMQARAVSGASASPGRPPEAPAFAPSAAPSG
jgi:predicted unusual protein kinase regulating ubiquinone biosynthesis (AarF/ABC1/UbiB family)